MATLLGILTVAAAGCLKWEPRNTDGVTITNGIDETLSETS